MNYTLNIKRYLDQLTRESQVVLGEETDGVSSLLGPTGSADAVHVVVDGLGQIDVDNVLDVLDVQSSSGDVGGHQNIGVAHSELVEGVVSGTLGHIAVELLRLDALGVQVLDEVVAPDLLGDEQEGLVLLEIETLHVLH